MYKFNTCYPHIPHISGVPCQLNSLSKPNQIHLIEANQTKSDKLHSAHSSTNYERVNPSDDEINR